MVADELIRELYAKINKLELEKIDLNDDLEDLKFEYDNLSEVYGALLIENEDLQKRYDELEVDYIAAKSQL